MRVPVLAFSLLLLTGCSLTPAPVLEPPAAEASYRPNAAATPRLFAVDAVTAQLMQAAVASYEVQRRVLLENLANAETVAFKRRVVNSGTQTITSSDGIAFQVPTVSGVATVNSPGTLVITDRNLDVGIDGDGFFAVVLVDGSTGYTRDGRLQVDANGKLVTATGNRLTPEITVPQDTLAIAIDPEGRVTVSTAGNPDCAIMMGQVQLSRFVNTDGLQSSDDVRKATAASGAPITATPGSNGVGLLKQGCLERSNVDSARELMQLQTLERQHQVLVHVLREFGYVAP